MPAMHGSVLPLRRRVPQTGGLSRVRPALAEFIRDTHLNGIHYTIRTGNHHEFVRMIGTYR